MQNSAAPPAPRSRFALVDALDREWAVLLEGLGSEAVRLDAQVVSGRRGDDRTLYRLVAAARDGDRLAGRVVLQSQLGRLVQMAVRDRGAEVDDYVSAFWCVLAGYPLERRPARIAANLALDTLKLVHRDRRWLGRSRAVVHPVGAGLDSLLHQGQRSGVEWEPGAAEVLCAGERLQLIDRPTRALLQAVYVEGLSGREAAARCATTPGSLRVRCSRAVHRLADHAAALAEAA